MDGDGHKLVCVEGSSKVDWLSSLHESLLYKVLLNLSTKDVVKCSLLSKRWRNLWKYVPGLELDEDNCPDFETFASFVDAFLGFNSESYLESFKLNYCDKNSVRYNWNAGSGVYEPEVGIVTRCWINTVFDRRVKHVVVVDYAVVDCDVWDVQMPPKFYTYESLVSLKLHGVILASPMFVCLPCLKFMDLTLVQASHDLDLEKLISGCPVLESLFIEKNLSDGIPVLRVCSQSLLRFTLFFDDIGEYLFERDLVVAINAPSLQYLRLGDDRIGSFILNNMSSLVEAYIDSSGIFGTSRILGTSSFGISGIFGKSCFGISGTFDISSFGISENLGASSFGTSSTLGNSGF